MLAYVRPSNESLHSLPMRGAARLSFTARIGRPSSFKIILLSSLVSFSWNGTRVGPTAAVERAHSDRARSGSKGSARVPFHPLSSCTFREQEDDQAAPSSFLRVHPRIPCWNSSPRIKGISPSLSEPLNFPTLSFAFWPFTHRHPGCSSISSSAHSANGRKGGEPGSWPMRASRFTFHVSS